MGTPKSVEKSISTMAIVRLSSDVGKRLVEIKAKLEKEIGLGLGWPQVFEWMLNKIKWESR